MDRWAEEGRYECTLERQLPIYRPAFKSRSFRDRCINESGALSFVAGASAGAGKAGISLRQHFFNSRNQGRNHVGHVMRHFSDIDEADDEHQGYEDDGALDTPYVYNNHVPKYGNELSDDDYMYAY